MFDYTNTGLNEPAPTTLQVHLPTWEISTAILQHANPVGFNFEIYGNYRRGTDTILSIFIGRMEAFSAHDINGKKTAKLPVNYKLISLVGNNKFANGFFTTGISGITIYGSNASGSWDNTGKISGIFKS